jgi:hypothetical protein
MSKIVEHEEENHLGEQVQSNMDETVNQADEKRNRQH